MTHISDIMTKDVETCSLGDTIYEVAMRMKELDVGVIPIVENKKLMGIITDRDIVLRCIADRQPPSSKVEDIMSENLFTVSPDTTTQEAARLMAKEQIRRLPVVENGELVGIVALGDLAVRDITDNQAKQALSEISEDDGEQAVH
ncbi:MAG TPA: CBS domain-containing protein [Bacillus bacterium]|uniref:CBS domain-containing protein n=1 Tax=Siminovitchia fordii TaxID=254759 RepID=UPI00037B87EA|nr:CBS domain-containing protein [Siminovitchia fordii]HBZ10323.1 CBS domain-containing protein [Bacillus sp. (in: firmicutes)]